MMRFKQEEQRKPVGLNQGEQLFYDQYRAVAIYKVKMLLKGDKKSCHVLVKGIRTAQEVMALFEQEKVAYNMIIDDGYHFIFH